MLRPEEQLWFYLLLSLVVFILISNFSSRDFWRVWSPLTIVALVFAYYTILGPLLSLSNEDTYFRLIDHRDFFLIAWRASFFSLLFIWLGFRLKRKKQIQLKGHGTIDVRNTVGFAKTLAAIGFLGSLVSFGLSGFRTFTGGFLEITNTLGGFSNYALFTINFFIPAAAILFIDYLKNKENLVLLILITVYALGIYTALGFRYRIILYVVTLYGCYHLILQKRPNVALAFFGVLFLVSVMGFIGLTRNYGRGLVIDESVESKETSDFFLAGFGESEVFQSSGLILSRVPEYYPHLGPQFLWETLAIPIPRAFWPEKPSGESLNAILEVYNREANAIGAGYGAAIFNYVEAYVAYGWSGLIVISFLWGWIFAVVWNFFRKNAANDLAIVILMVFNAFIYVVISRGYLPQIAYTFFFTVFPVIWYWKRTKNAHASASVRMLHQ